MPDEDKNFGGSLVLDFRKWWRHVQAKDTMLYEYGYRKREFFRTFLFVF